MSRPRSAATAKPAKAAKPSKAPARGGARPGGRPGGVFVATPKSDVYVALLGVALGAMIIAILLLTLVLYRYDFAIKP